jgi:AcrR family transcriptional regulator
LARTPSKEAHEKVLDATYKLISERGIEGTSMDAIAAESGVSKATVYKHWANKDALLIDVVKRQSSNDSAFNSGDPRADLIALLTYMARRVKSEQLLRVWPQIVGYAASNPRFARAMHEHIFTPRRDAVVRLLAEAAEKSGLRKDIDPDFAMDLLIGPVMHRRFLDSGKIPPDMPERVVDFFWKVYAAPKRR